MNRTINHSPLPFDALPFEALNYSVRARNWTRQGACEVQAFATLKEAEEYALECADADRGEFYDVFRVGHSEVRMSARMAA